MHETMRTLLNAYHDEELRGQPLHNLEAHLAECDECRAELAEIRRLSGLLQSSPLREVAPVEGFIAALSPRLPPREPTRNGGSKAGWIWWLVPVGLLGALVFLQVVYTLSNVVATASLAGWLGQASFSLGSSQNSLWYLAAAFLFGQHVETLQVLARMNELEVFGSSLVTGFLWQAVVVLLYWIWLVIGWRRGRILLNRVQPSARRPSNL